MKCSSVRDNCSGKVGHLNALFVNCLVFYSGCLRCGCFDYSVQEELFIHSSFLNSLPGPLGELKHFHMVRLVFGRDFIPPGAPTYRCRKFLA